MPSLKGDSATFVFHYPSFTPLNLSAFAITDTELKLIARAAIIGESRMPKNGNNTPAAIGTPRVL